MPSTEKRNSSSSLQIFLLQKMGLSVKRNTLYSKSKSFLLHGDAFREKEFITPQYFFFMRGRSRNGIYRCLNFFFMIGLQRSCHLRGVDLRWECCSVLWWTRTRYFRIYSVSHDQPCDTGGLLKSRRVRRAYSHHGWTEYFQVCTRLSLPLSLTPLPISWSFQRTSWRFMIIYANLNIPSVARPTIRDVLVWMDSSQ